MADYSLLLFNEQNKHELIQKVNQVLQENNQSFQLTSTDVGMVLDSREQALKDNHLIDFSLRNVSHFMEQVAQDEIMTKNQYLTTVDVLQESFYYLHSIQPAEDEAIWEKIWDVYKMFDGNLEYIQGYIEDFPDLKQEE